MASNHQLTKIIAGRTIRGTSNSTGESSVAFDDGSKMTIKTADSDNNSANTGGTIDKVRQDTDPPLLHLDLTDGSTVSLPLADATSSVLLRDASGAMEYAD